MTQGSTPSASARMPASLDTPSSYHAALDAGATDGKAASVRGFLRVPYLELLAGRALAISLGTLALGGCLKPPEQFADEPEAEPAGPPSTAGEVLARHIAALGGEKELRAIGQRTIDAQMIFRAEEGCDPEDESCLGEDQTGSFLLQSTAKGEMYRRTVLGDIIEEKGFDGETGWSLQAGTVLRIDNAEETQLAREDATLHWYFDLEGRKVSTTLIKPRKEDSDGTVMTLDGIEWFIGGEGGAPKRMWFDRETGLLREETVEEGEGADLQGQLIQYLDYELIDEVMVPMSIRVTTRVGDRAQVLDIVTQKVDHQPIDAKNFAVPELPDPEPIADELLTALQQAAREAKDGDIVSLMEHARIAFVAAHFEEAEFAAKRALEVDPKEPEALLIVARVQVLRGEYKEGRKTLGKAAKAGVRGDVLARQKAWIEYRERNYSALADALDEAKNPVLAGRFRSFIGSPVKITSGKDCVVTVPLTANEPLATAELEVEGTTVGAIVDTGAATMILAESLAKELGVTVRPLGAAQGGPLVGHGQVDELKIGSVVIENVPVDVFSDAEMSRNAGDLGDKGVRAALGVSLLSDFTVTVDAPGKRLELVRGGKACAKQRGERRVGANVPLWIHETHYMYVVGQLEGAEGVYLLNTGIRGTDLAATSVAYAHAGIGTPPVRDGEAPMVEVAELRVGDAFSAKKLTAAYGFFEQTQTTDGFRLDGMLGLGVLGRQAFTVDFEERRLWFPPSG